MNTGCQLLSHQDLSIGLDRHNLSLKHTNVLGVSIVPKSAIYIMYKMTNLGHREQYFSKKSCLICIYQIFWSILIHDTCSNLM